MTIDALVIVGLAVLLVLLSAAYYTKSLDDMWRQSWADAKRHRAHDGKVVCEDTTESCDKVATMVTHNGYFCDTHWEENSKWMVGGGFVTWHHPLNHTTQS